MNDKPIYDEEYGRISADFWHALNNAQKVVWVDGSDKQDYCQSKEERKKPVYILEF